MKHFSFFMLLLFISIYTKATDLNSVGLRRFEIIQHIDTPKFATLYVYRRYQRGTSLNGYKVHVADSVICRARNDSKYIIRLFKEGPTEIWAETEQKKVVSLNVEFGREYYLKCELKIGVIAARPELSIVSPERGKWEFDNTEGLNSKKKSADDDY